MVCTWIGETAAAGAVRTGIPLRGLLGEECIWTVWPGPSARPDSIIIDYCGKRSSDKVSNMIK